MQIPEGPFDIDGVMRFIETDVVDVQAKGNGGPPAVAPREESAAPREANKPPAHRVEDGTPGTAMRGNIGEMQRHQYLEIHYMIKSHRPVLGAVTDFFKKFMHWGARPYTDMLRAEQMAFNDAAVRGMQQVAGQLEALNRRIGELDQRAETIVQKLNETYEWVCRHNDRMDEIEQKYEGRDEQFDRDIHDHGRQLEAQQRMLNILDGREPQGEFFGAVSVEKRLAALDATRGTMDDIRGRQYRYLELFRDAPGQVLDLGCGRGELIRVLRLEGIECWGCETDPLMAQIARADGNHVVERDALSELGRLPDGLLGGLFAAQVVEHLHAGELLHLLRLARHKLKKGARIVLETLNPSSLAVLAKSYYRDIDHKQPIHPDYLKLLLELAGFERVERHDLAPFRPDEKLQTLPPAAELGITEAARDALQARLDHLNGLLYADQDYFVVGVQGEPASPDEGEPA